MCRTVHDKMSAAAILACNTQARETGKNFITGSASRYVWAVAECCKSINERNFVDVLLLLSKIVFCVFQDAREILFDLSTEMNA